MSADIEKVDPSSAYYYAVANAPDRLTRLEAARDALDLVEHPNASQPVPRLFYDLPWQTSEDDAVASILTNLILAEDIMGATNPAPLPKASDFVDMPLVVSDIRAMASNLDDAQWGAYVVLDVEFRDGGRRVMSTGAQQVIVTLWRCWCEGRFPVTGRFVLLGNKTKGRSQPLGFAVEAAEEPF